MHTRWLWGLLMIILAPLCCAHEPFEITTNVQINADRIRINLLITDSTAAKLCLLDSGPRTTLHERELDAAHAQIEQCISAMFVLQDGELQTQRKVLAAQTVELRLTEEKDLDATLTYPPCSSGKLSIEAVYFAQLDDPTYGSTLTAVSGQRFLVQKLLTRDSPEVNISLTESQRPTKTSFIDFYRLGIAHILVGYDHLLFLAGLLIVCLSVRTCLIIITAFTLAHSLALAFAALQWISIPSGRVETAIAASIVFVGIENLWRTRKNVELQGRWLLAFGFGLIHGLGFANALLTSGLPTSGIQLLVPLLAFNLGVETGQLTVAAIVLPCLFWFRRYSWFALRFEPLISMLIVVAGLYWLLERMNIL